MRISRAEFGGSLVDIDLLLILQDIIAIEASSVVAHIGGGRALDLAVAGFGAGYLTPVGP